LASILLAATPLPFFHRLFGDHYDLIIPFGGTMKKKMSINVFLLLFLLGLSTLSNAAPISIGGPVSMLGDGVNSRWVNTSYSPHNVDAAISALSLNPGNAGYVSEVNDVVLDIDFADSNYPGRVAGFNPDPLTPDNNFAVRYSGYINIAASDNYTFNAFTDDGFRLTIGGEMISQYYGDRSPGNTTTTIYLDAGFYTFEMIGWEQGGVFVNELSWRDSSTESWSLVTSDVLFTGVPSTPVPEPSTIFLLSSGLVGFLIRRKKK
jgi:hypothetical protein